MNTTIKTRAITRIAPTVAVIMNNQPALFDPMTAGKDELLSHVDDVADDPRIWPKSLAELVDMLVDDLTGQGMDEDDAIASARRTVCVISYDWGGRMRYLPKNDSLRIALRDNQIWRQFCQSRNRRAITELAEKYNLSDQMVYSIISQQKKMTIKRKQGDLFAEKTQEKKHERA